MSEPEQNGHWALDKRIPMATLAALVMQTSGMVWWAAALQTKVDNNEKALVRIDMLGSPITRERLVVLENARIIMDDRLKRIEAGVEKINDKIDDLKAKR